MVNAIPIHELLEFSTIETWPIVSNNLLWQPMVRENHMKLLNLLEVIDIIISTPSI